MNFRELPQNIIGKLLSINSFKIIRYTMNDGVVKNVYFKNNFFKSGISLGDYIILDKLYLNRSLKELNQAINHEYGHSIQSKKLSWLYLIVVGIPSMIRNIYNRWFHKGWSYDRKCKWYYSGFPENWADKLGGIER